MEWIGEDAPVNVGRAERLLTGLAGLGLMAPTLRRRSVVTVAAAVAGGALLYRAATGRCRLYRALEVNTAETAPSTAEGFITIGKPAEALHALWRDPEAFAKVTRGVVEVSPIDDAHARWRVVAPLGKTLEWTTEVVEEAVGRPFHWRSVPESALKTEGWLRIADAPRDWGAEVRLQVAFDLSGLPAGALLQPAASLFGQVPKTMVNKLLRNFKSLAETGEVPTLDRNSSARPAADGEQGDWV